MRDMFLFMCFTGLSYVDLKAITYDNIHTDPDGGTWLMGNRIKTGVAYVVNRTPRICRSGHTQGDAAGNSSESVWA